MNKCYLMNIEHDCNGYRTIHFIGGHVGHYKKNKKPLIGFYSSGTRQFQGVWDLKIFSLLFVLSVFRRPIISVISFLALQFDQECLRREVRFQMNVQINFIFLNRILFKPANRKVLY
jgi:hypothetical protein